MTNSTQLPSESIQHRSQSRTLLRWAVLSLLCLGVVALLWIFLVARHANSTPTFAAYIASHPVAPERFDPPAGAVELGGPSGWLVGDVDPFTVPDDNAKFATHEIRFELEIRRGETVLLHLVQVIALATERVSGASVGAGVRTSELVVHTGLRASAKVYIANTARMLVPENRRVAFDVLLGAGSGPNIVGVYGLPADDSDGGWEGIGLPGESALNETLQGLVGKLWPVAALPEEGLIHRVYATGHTFAPGGMGRDFEEDHEVNTDEYSYCVTTRTTVEDESGTGNHGGTWFSSSTSDRDVR